MKIFNQLLQNSKWACLALVLSFSTTTSFAQWNNTAGFEAGWGIWNDGGSDALRFNDSNTALPGDYCVRIRDNSNGGSSMYTDNIDLSGYSQVTIIFQYIAESMESGEDFFLEYSSNGGTSYEKIKTYASGNHFQNGQHKTETVVINKSFTNRSVFRFRCDASSNYDMIYIDEVNMNTGGNGGGNTGGNCSVSVASSNIQCDSKGTSTIDDDTFTVDVRVTGSNTSGKWAGDLGGQHKEGNIGQTVTFGPFNTNHGSTISGWFMDKNDQNCAYDITVTAPRGCSDDVPAGCTGNITGFSINTHNSGLIENINGREFCSTEFEATDISIRAHVSGAHQSLKYTIQTPQGSWTNTENAETYDSKRFWATAVGTYRVTAQLYSNDNLGGTQCDSETVTFTIKDCPVTPVDPCPTKTINVRNTGSCPVYAYRWETTGDVYLGYIGAGNSKNFHLTEGQTVRVIDTNRNWNNLDFDKSQIVGAACNQTFTVSPDYCTTVDPCPNKTIKVTNNGACGVNVYRWETAGDVYLGWLGAGNSRTFSVAEGKMIRVTNQNVDWNNILFDKSYTVGAACDQTLTVNPDYCQQQAGCTGKITGFSINTHTSGLIGNINGSEFCTTEFEATDISIRAHVSGAHQSLRFTIQAPQGNINNTENAETYDSKRFWATAAGTYTVTAKLYSNDNLGGTECDSETVTFTIKNCNTGGGNTGGSCNFNLVTYEGFEGGYDHWNDGGSDCYRIQESNAAAGNYCVRLRDNSGAASSIISDELKFAGVNQCKIDFTYFADSMEADEDFMLEFSNDGGKTYKIIQSWARGKEFENGRMINESVTFSENFTDWTKLRIRCDASGNQDLIYLDEIKVYACGGNYINSDDNTIHSATQNTVIATSVLELDKAPSEKEVDEAESKLGVYPNPATHTLNIKGLKGATYDVFNLTGQRVIQSSTDKVLNLSGLNTGTYLLRTVDGQVIRFIKN